MMCVRVRKQEITTSVLLILLLVFTMLSLAVAKQKKDAPLYVSDGSQAYYALMQEKANVEHAPFSQRETGLVFEGMCDQETLSGILSMLDNDGVQATFFLSSTEWMTQKDALAQVSRLGYGVGITGYSPQVSLASLAQNRAINEMLSASYQMQDQGSTFATALLWKEKNPSKQLLQTAYACGMERMSIPTSYVSAQSFISPQEAQAYVSHLQEQSTVCIWLDEHPNLLQTVQWVLEAITEP